MSSTTTTTPQMMVYVDSNKFSSASAVTSNPKPTTGSDLNDR